MGSRDHAVLSGSPWHVTAGIARSFGGVYLATLLMQLGATLLITCLSLRLSATGASDVWVGALTSASALGMVFGGAAGRMLIGRLGHVRAHGASGGIIVLAALAYGLTTALPVWLLLRVVVGTAMMCQLMVLESWLNERAEGSQRGKVLAIYMIVTYAGMMLGQLAVGLDDGSGTFALPAVALAFALCVVPLALNRGTRPAVLPAAAVPTAAGPRVRALAQPFATVLVSGMLNGTFFSLSAVYAARQGMSTAEVGRFLALTVVAGLAAQLPLGLLSDRVPRASLIRWIAILLAVVCVPLGHWQGLPQGALMAFAIAIGSLQFCMYPLSVALANERVDPAQRVRLAGMLLSVFGIGSCLGPPLAGALMTRAGTPSLYYFFAACAGVLALCVGQARGAGIPTRPHPSACMRKAD